jgi:hypothetical protein
MSHLVIVGGSNAGISAALRARELDPSTRVTLIVEDTFPNYSICGLPFYLSGEVPDSHQLAHRTREEITEAGIDLHTPPLGSPWDLAQMEARDWSRAKRKQAFPSSPPKRSQEEPMNLL